MQANHFTEIALFPIKNSVFFPSTVKPLNIFEPRYLEMIQDSIELDRQVALISPISESAPVALDNFRAICGAGNVRLLEKREDGTMLVALESARKYELQSIEKRGNYYIAQARFVEEDVSVKEEHLHLLSVLNHAIGNWMENFIPDPQMRLLLANQLSTPQEKVNYFSSFYFNEFEVQQELLECGSVAERLEQLVLSLPNKDIN